MEPHGAGKSTLGKICNRALSFADWEGIPLSRTNTAKGPQRQLAAQSSVAVPLLEWSEKSKMAEEDLLNLYGRNPQQIRAAATNDGTYIAVPFNCSLVLIQNEEPFTLRQVKERIVSLKFEKENVTAETAMASKRLLNRRPEITATVGIQLLRNRKYFEEKIQKNLINNNILISAHGNSIRALCKYLFILDNNQISNLEIPTGNPLIIELNEKLKINNCEYLDKERAKSLLVF